MNYASNNVSILLGTGTGSFGIATNFPVGTQPRSVAVGDFNADARQDLAVANEVSNNRHEPLFRFSVPLLLAGLHRNSRPRRVSLRLLRRHIPPLQQTRGQLSKIVVIAAGWALLDPPTPTFSDVPYGSKFYQYVETAYSRGIFSGYADGTFRPGNNATRGQIARIVYNAVTAP